MRSVLRVGTVAWAMLVAVAALLVAVVLAMSTIGPLGPNAYDGLTPTDVAAIGHTESLTKIAAWLAVVVAASVLVAIIARWRVGLAAAAVGLAAVIAMSVLARAAVHPFAVGVYCLTGALFVCALVPLVRGLLRRDERTAVSLNTARST